MVERLKVKGRRSKVKGSGVEPFTNQIDPAFLDRLCSADAGTHMRLLLPGHSQAARKSSARKEDLRQPLGPASLRAAKPVRRVVPKRSPRQDGILASLQAVHYHLLLL